MQKNTDADESLLGGDRHLVEDAAQTRENGVTWELFSDQLHCLFGMVFDELLAIEKYSHQNREHVNDDIFGDLALLGVMEALLDEK